MITFFSLLTALAPENVRFAFEKRYATFQNLDADKSYAIRKLMVQKGLRLFEANPWFGVGVSRWRKENTSLDIPRVLQYALQSHFDRKSPHNSYISFLAENGLVGTLPYALLLLILTLRGYRAAFSLSQRGEIWAIGIYAGFIGMSIHLWTLAGLTGTAPWFIYGLVAAIIIFERQTPAAKKKTSPYESRFPLSHSRHH